MNQRVLPAYSTAAKFSGNASFNCRSNKLIQAYRTGCRIFQITFPRLCCKFMEFSVAATKVSLKSFPCDRTGKSPAGLAGLLSLLFLLSGCQAVSTPEQVTRAFWETMAEGNVDSARKYATQETQYLVTKQQNLEDATLKTGAVLIDGSNATVSTVMTLKKPENNKVLSFNTVLLKEDDVWKVDYLQTLNNLLNLPFGDIFKSLRAIGETLNRELELQIPLFEKQIKSFSEELIRQLDEFRRQLEKSAPPEKQQPHSRTL